MLPHTAKDELKRLAEELGGNAGNCLLNSSLAKLIQTTQEIVCIPPRVAFSFRPDIGQAWCVCCWCHLTESSKAGMSMDSKGAFERGPNRPSRSISSTFLLYRSLTGLSVSAYF